MINIDDATEDEITEILSYSGYGGGEGADKVGNPTMGATKATQADTRVFDSESMVSKTS